VGGTAIRIGTAIQYEKRSFLRLHWSESPCSWVMHILTLCKKGGTGCHAYAQSPGRVPSQRLLSSATPKGAQNLRDSPINPATAAPQDISLIPLSCPRHLLFGMHACIVLIGTHWCNVQANCRSPKAQANPNAAGIRDIMLIRKWVPQDNLEYAGCIIVVLFAGIVTSCLRMLRGVWETHGRIANSTVCPPPLLLPFLGRNHALLMASTCLCAPLSSLHRSPCWGNILLVPLWNVCCAILLNGGHLRRAWRQWCWAVSDSAVRQCF
jgi:hypothetical protein